MFLVVFPDIYIAFSFICFNLVVVAAYQQWTEHDDHDLSDVLPNPLSLGLMMPG